MKFRTLMHYVCDLEMLRDAFQQLKRKAAPGVDGVTWQQYREGLEQKLADLSDRLRRGAYRAKPSRRAYIPKADGRQRPLGVAALEDKIVQRATVEVLNAIYEQDFAGFSYGFRPGRGQHNALDALYGGIIRRQARGDVAVVRFADDIVVGFQYREEAERFLAELRGRFAKFGLELHPEKTRLIEFGRYAADDREKRGEGKPETFDFLGFTHICGKTKEARFTVLRQTIRKRMQAKLIEVKAELRRRMHDPVPEVGQWLRSVITGHVRYYGVPTNGRAIGVFRHQVGRRIQSG